MKIFPYKRVHVAERLWVKVSNHFHYSDFGVRDTGEMRYTGRRYIASNTPGTGFIERESESHSYHEFVRRALQQQRRSYLRMLLGREPDFGREIATVTAALQSCDDPRKREILECYLNALSVARSEEKLQRIVRGIKDRIGHHSNKYLVSVMSHYKNKIAQLSKDIHAVEYHIKDRYPEPVMQAYADMVQAFTKMAACRRIWHHNEQRSDHFVQVFFDLAIFDFIRSDYYLPLLRDSFGNCFYLLPDSVLVARSSVDFDIVPLKTLTIVSQELAIEEPVDVLSTRLGDAASMIRIPDLNLTYYFNHVHAIVNFVAAVDKLKATL